MIFAAKHILCLECDSDLLLHAGSQDDYLSTQDRAYVKTLSALCTLSWQSSAAASSSFPVQGSVIPNITEYIKPPPPSYRGYGIFQPAQPATAALRQLQAGYTEDYGYECDATYSRAWLVSTQGMQEIAMHAHLD